MNLSDAACKVVREEPCPRCGGGRPEFCPHCEDAGVVYVAIMPVLLYANVAVYADVKP